MQNLTNYHVDNIAFPVRAILNSIISFVINGLSIPKRLKLRSKKSKPRFVGWLADM